jgi:hypothetical protein
MASCGVPTHLAGRLRPMSQPFRFWLILTATASPYRRTRDSGSSSTGRRAASLDFVMFGTRESWQRDSGMAGNACASHVASWRASFVSAGRRRCASSSGRRGNMRSFLDKLQCHPTVTMYSTGAFFLSASGGRSVPFRRPTRAGLSRIGRSRRSSEGTFHTSLRVVALWLSTRRTTVLAQFDSRGLRQ